MVWLHMLFNFIGAPQSGKTTIAAMTFASLKETGIVAEFSSEQARFYIARKRVKLGLSPAETVPLEDEDHITIMEQQLYADETLVKSCGSDVTIISDSSPLNSVLYMTKDATRSKKVLDMVDKTLAITDCCFYLHLIFGGWSNAVDPNRVHSEVQSRAVDSLTTDMIRDVPTLSDKTIPVFGTMRERLLTVQNRILFP